MGLWKDGVRPVRDQFRTIRLFTGTLLETKLEDELPVMSWMVLWVAESMHRFRAGADGKTAYQRSMGRRFHDIVLAFGESVWWRAQRKTGEPNMDSQWDDGVWFGT